MRRCPVCDARHATQDGSVCPACGFRPAMVDGFEAYAPDLAHGGGGFKASYFAELARLEAANFWFRGRNDIIDWALNKHVPGLQSFLEIGCGTGYVLSMVGRRFPAARVVGSEVFTAGLPFAAQRLPAAQFVQMDARRIPFEDEFDAVGAFDVLEHIEEDHTVLEQVRRALRPNGHLVLTVPQHPWLWSAADEHACHVRRYTAQEVHGKLEAAGFDIRHSTSFVSLLLPAMMASRLKKAPKDQAVDPAAEFKLPAWMNSSFHAVMKSEAGLIKAGVKFPLGGSRLVVAQRRG